MMRSGRCAPSTLIRTYGSSLFIMRIVLLLISLVGSTSVWADGCEYKAQDMAGLTVRNGYVDFIHPTKLAPLKDSLPLVVDTDINTAMRSPDTMWYDEDSMVFLYQDSAETVVGGRANCVGREVGENNADNDAIHKLVNYFGPDYRFKFPFRTAAGTDNVTNKRVMNFWAPPKKNGSVLPVKWWQPTSRGRWRWTFPVGTLFGEVLYLQGPDGRWYVFEIRTRKRYRDGWATNIFRPFPTAQSLVEGIQRVKPNWFESLELWKFVQYLQNKNTLVKHRLVSEAYGKVFPPIDGALDILPEISDTQLIQKLLSETPFVSAEGKIWKENGSLETYAASSKANFSIVPKGYEAGMIAVNEVSCRRCHSEVGRTLAHFEWDVQLYGEMWGEDEIFTWHIFEPNRYIFATFDDVDGSRKVNPRFQQAGLVKKEKPSDSDPDYKAMPTVYQPVDRTSSKRNARYAK